MIISPPTDDRLKVLDGYEAHGDINTDDATLAANVTHSIRLGYPQVRPQPIQGERVILVGGGPSLTDTFEELRALHFEGAKVVTVNGSYDWCLERNIRPSAQIMLDAQAHNARFVATPVPQCRYILASQCHPDTWEMVKGRDVWIWQSVALDNLILAPLLNTYYRGRWMATPGGTTVIMRAILVLRALGYLRMDLFGVDSCYAGRTHHAYPQTENDGEDVYRVTVHAGDPAHARTFICAGWMVKQLECFLQTIRLNGDSFLLNVHGDGLLAFALKSAAFTITQTTKE